MASRPLQVERLSTGYIQVTRGSSRYAVSFINGALMWVDWIKVDGTNVRVFRHGRVPLEHLNEIIDAARDFDRKAKWRP